MTMTKFHGAGCPPIAFCLATPLSFNSQNIRSLPILYKSLVRPHLEYANVTWGPSYIGDVQMIEKVQRRATKCILELVDLEYDNCLMALNLSSLSYRKHHAEMLMAYNICDPL